MSFRHSNFAKSNKLLNRSSINSSLINISKQLQNISINDVNILKLKNEKNKLSSKNKKGLSVKKENSKFKINLNKSFKYSNIIYKTFPSLDSDFDDYDINFSFCRIESFSFLADKYINTLNKNDLRKKNYILKENLNFLLKEIKKYKNQEMSYNNDKIIEYENKLEYYINEIKKYKKEILLLKEKYNKVIIENKELQKLLQIDSNKLNNKKGSNQIYKKDLNSQTYKPSNIKNLKSFKKININLKNYLNKKNIIKENFSTRTTKISRNNKNIELNIPNNVGSSKYHLIDDKISYQNSKKKVPINHSLTNNSVFIINSKLIKKNNNNIINSNKNNKNSFQKLKSNNNNQNTINQIIFSRLENSKFNKNYDYRTLSKQKLNQNSLKNTSFGLNKTINISNSFRYFKDKEIKNLDSKKFYHSKYNNYIYLNNSTFHN